MQSLISIAVYVLTAKYFKHLRKGNEFKSYGHRPHDLLQATMKYLDIATLLTVKTFLFIFSTNGCIINIRELLLSIS